MSIRIEKSSECFSFTARGGWIHLESTEKNNSCSAAGNNSDSSQWQTIKGREN